jgi:multidrug resistance efflux pump
MRDNVSRSRFYRVLVRLAAVAVIVAVVILAWPSAPAPMLIGMVRTTEIKIAPEINGRLVALSVKAGDHVRAGSVVALLDNPELTAAIEQARATLGTARVIRAQVYSGARRAQVDILARQLDKATADLTLAKQEYERASAVMKAGYGSKQRLDEAQALVDTAQANLISLRSQLAELQHGPTPEERTYADAQAAAAEASLNVLERTSDKLRLKAPADGIVQTVVDEPGDPTQPGRPVLTITADEAPWFSFNIREDALAGMDIGSVLTLTRSGSEKPIRVKISEIRRLGEFATWRAARTVGDRDLNMFAVRADLMDAAPELEPGMTVWIATGARRDATMRSATP